MTKNLTDRFIDEFIELSVVDFSESVVHQTKRCLLDYLGSTLAGARMMHEKGNKLLRFMQDVPGNASVVGFARKTSAENAAFLNGLSSHIAELDDGVISGIVHPGSPVISALLPVAERDSVSGEALLKGIIVGYEVATRFAEAIQPSHKKRGYHATGTCGSIGAALGISAMLGFDRTQTKATLSAAAVSAHGTLKVLEDNSELKPYNVAQAATSAVLAASMGYAGFAGPDDALSGTTGFIAMLSDEFDADILSLKHIDKFAVERVYVKPYAACRYCHPPIDAVIQILKDHHLDPKLIKQIKVDTYNLAVSKHDHSEVSGISSAKMSIPYSVAVAFVTGKAGIGEFSQEHIDDPLIASLAGKVRVQASAELTKLFPMYSAAVVEVTTLGGDCIAQRIDSPKGESSLPLTDREIEEKCKSLAIYGQKSEVESQKIIEAVWNLEVLFHNLFQLL